MRDKKVLILIVLAIFAVISLIYGITAPRKVRAVRSAVLIKENLLPGEGAVSTVRKAKRTLFTSWKRSPFMPSGSASSDLVLNGIIWNKDKPRAMIGDVIVGKGDRIAENTVVGIKPDRIILNDGVKDFELKLEK